MLRYPVLGPHASGRRARPAYSGGMAAAARASGTNHFNDCNPSCANGRIIHIQTTLTLSCRCYYRHNYVYECYAIKPRINGFGRFCLP